MARGTTNQELATALHQLDELTNWENRPRGDMRVGLEPMQDLTFRLGNPHLVFRTIHVAGTKGKGSTSALIESALLAAGFKAGRYGSPHVESVTERVSVDGVPVDEESLARALNKAMDAYRAAVAENTAGHMATWFDLITVAGFIVFAEAGVDWAVIEVGLGGRLDSTNVVESDVAVITNIELEHTEILGDTRPLIAAEKAGIIKSGCEVVTGLAEDDPAGIVVKEKAAECGCPVVYVDLEPIDTISGRNEAVAAAVLDLLGKKGVITPNGPQKGHAVGGWLLDVTTRARARLPGRMERHDLPSTTGNGLIPVILDGAHVPFNLEAVLHDLATESDLDGSGIAVLALASDKDAHGMVEIIAKHRMTPIFTEIGGSVRVRSAEDIKAIAAGFGLDGVIERDAEKAFSLALEEASRKKGWVLVTGSLHLVGLIRERCTAEDDNGSIAVA